MDRKDEDGQQGNMVSVEVVRDLVHDLRNPLVAASGFLTLLERAGDGPAAERYTASLRESIETLKEVLDRTRERYCRMATH
jgi:signal transduction histidine kinase